MSDPSEPSFEEALRRLEEIVRRLEAGEASLDEALALWQEGDALRRRCVSLLDAAEAKIEELDDPTGDNAATVL